MEVKAINIESLSFHLGSLIGRCMSLLHPYQLKLDAILLPVIALLICLGGWALIAGHGKTTTSVDDFGD